MSPNSIAALESLLTSPSFFDNPYPVYHRLRQEAPVYWSDALGGWVMTRYSDVVASFKDPARFRSSGRVTYLLAQLPENARQQVEALESHYRVGIAHSDPPDHTRLRALISKAFTPKVLEASRPRIEQVVKELLDVVESKGEMDVIGDIAYPLPATIISELIGAPPQDREKFREWAMAINALFSGGGRVVWQNVKRAQDTVLEMRAYLKRLADERRKNPKNDILSELINAEDQGNKLNDAELVSTCVTLFVAGHETTTNLIGNGMLALLRHADQMQKLKDDPSLITTAVEEMLRYDTSVQRGWRLAGEDIRFDGHDIRAGDLVLPMIGAANRDPNQFPNPDGFDITRGENKHLGFGVGIHFCLGAPLARIEAPIAISEMLKRLPDLHLATEKVEWLPDIAMRGLKRLPVGYG